MSHLLKSFQCGVGEVVWLTLLLVRRRLSQAIEPSPAPPSTPGSSLPVSASQLSLTGSPWRVGARAAYDALTARQARGRPWSSVAVNAADLVAPRLWGTEDCAALADSLCLEEVELSVVLPFDPLASSLCRADPCGLAGLSDA